MAASQNHRHDGVDQQVGGGHQHLDRGDLQGGWYGGGGAVEEGDYDETPMMPQAMAIFFGSWRVVADPGS